MELDVLNFAALENFQGFTAIPYAGDKAFLVTAPFGWVIDATRGRGCLATMYQRGLCLSAAHRKKEFLYINYWDRRAEPLSAAELDRRQTASMRFSLGSMRVSHRPTIQRSDAVTRLRIANIKKYKCLELTGFLEFKDVIFFAVLLTRQETQHSNIRRLEAVLKQAIPISLQRDNSELIVSIQEQLKLDLPIHERARLLREAGHWYRDMDQLQDARRLLDESLSLVPTSYQTIKELLPVLTGLRERNRAKEIMECLLRIEPHNPTVFNDCLTHAAGWIETSELLSLIDNFKAEQSNDELVCANCDFYAGNLLVSKPRLARERYLAAQEIFRRILPRDHHVFRSLRLGLRRVTRR